MAKMNKKVVASGKYMPMTEKRGAAVEIGGKLHIFNGKRKSGFLNCLAKWCCKAFGISATNPTIEIRTGSLSNYQSCNEIVINSD